MIWRVKWDGDLDGVWDCDWDGGLDVIGIVYWDVDWECGLEGLIGKVIVRADLECD